MSKKKDIMRFNNILLLGLVLFYMCTNKTNKKYFEGIVTYRIEYNSNGTSEQSPFGDTMIAYYKDGYIKKSYNSKSTIGIKEEIYDPVSKRLYMKIGDNDTLIWQDVRKNPNLTLIHSSDSKNPEIILDNECRLYSSIKRLKKGSFEIETKLYYYYSDVLKVDPKLFKDYKYAFTDKLYYKTEAHYLKFIIENTESKLEIEAIDIDPQKLQLDIFEIDKMNPQKELKF